MEVSAAAVSGVASTVLALTATARPARTVIARLSVVVRHREIVHRTAIVPSLMTAVPVGRPSSSVS